MTDLVIIGAGPAGLTAAIYARRAGLDFLLLDQDGCGGGQITSAHRVQNYPGLPGITGEELGERLRSHAQSLGVEVQYGQVVSLSRTGEGFFLTTDEGTSLRSRAVIAAVGASPRHLGLPGEDTLAGVSYCAHCDGAFFTGQNVAVVGGGDTAVADALYLSQICAHVTVLLRRDRFRAAPAEVEQLLRRENVSVRRNVQVKALVGREHLSALGLSTGEALPCAGLFIAAGTVPATGFLGELPILTQEGYIWADETGKTAIPGLFAAGDSRKKPLRQLVTAVADGANAATSAWEFLRQAVK
jgi:thioredoxin reductase (NADPH)